MRCWFAVLILLSCGCIHTKPTVSVADTNLGRTPEYQQEIDAILAEDAENKRWEGIYLKEIAIAQDNDDHDAYKFFIVEYIKLPRMKLPDWMKQEPGYVQPISATDVLRGQIRIRVIQKQ